MRRSVNVGAYIFDPPVTRGLPCTRGANLGYIISLHPEWDNREQGTYIPSKITTNIKHYDRYLIWVIVADNLTVLIPY